MNPMEQFYEQVLRRLREHWAQDGRTDANPTVAELAQGPARRDGLARDVPDQHRAAPALAVSYLREQVKTEVKTFLRRTAARRAADPAAARTTCSPRRPGTAGAAGGTAIDDDYLDEFTGKLAGMLPANFTPQGSGPLKVLICYPSDAQSATIENYLKSSINLPPGQSPTTTGPRGPSRSRWCCSAPRWASPRSMRSVTCSGCWAGALAQPGTTDLLRWRQRTGYDFGYLATREEHRVEILHRLLCALWNGKATALGPPESPERINVTLGGDVTMTLPLDTARPGVLLG